MWTERVEKQCCRQRGASVQQETSLFSPVNPSAWCSVHSQAELQPCACLVFYHSNLPGFCGPRVHTWEAGKIMSGMRKHSVILWVPSAESDRNNTFSYLKGSLSSTVYCTETLPFLCFALTFTFSETCNLMTDLIIQDTIVICVEKSYWKNLELYHLG